MIQLLAGKSQIQKFIKFDGFYSKYQQLELQRSYLVEKVLKLTWGFLIFLVLQFWRAKGIYLFGNRQYRTINFNLWSNFINFCHFFTPFYHYLIIKVVLHFLFLGSIAIDEQHISIQIFVILCQFLILFTDGLILLFAFLQIFVQFRIGLLHFLYVLLIRLVSIDHAHIVKLGQFALKNFIEILHHQFETVENWPFANYIFYVIENFHHQLINLFFFVQTQRVLNIFTLIDDTIFSLSLEITHLDILLKCQRLIHHFYYNRIIIYKLPFSSQQNNFIESFLFKINSQLVICNQQVWQSKCNRQQQNIMSKSQSSIQQVQNLSSLYDFQQVLGQGTFATVWRTRQKTGSNLLYAIKQVQVHPLEKDMAYKQVQNLQKVESDHIIKYFTSIYDSSESTLNLIMELCSGSLRKQILTKVYTREELLSFIIQMNSAFLELLQKKLMHLDLKPQNILISQNTGNCYKICDFGCAQIAFKSKMTKYDNQLFGTFNYLAPENYLHYQGKLTNTSADIWSLGVILYEMIYKRLPFEVDRDGLIDRKAIQEYFEGKEEKIIYPVGPPEDLIEIVKKMLKPKPKNRITWMQLRSVLIKNNGIDEYYFLNTKKIYFKHMKTLKIFLTFVFIISKDMELNPHPFWKNNDNLLIEISVTLTHLCYLYTLKFDAIYGYKMGEFLQQQWIQNLNFMRKHIKFQQQNLAKIRHQKVSSLADLEYIEEVFKNCVKQMREQLANHSEFWVTMEDLEIFCQQTIRRGETKRSFFAAGDNNSYGETMKALDIQ